MNEGLPTLSGVLICAIASAFALWIARKSGFYRPLQPSAMTSTVSFWHVISGFLIYFAASLFAAPVLGAILHRTLSVNAGLIGFVAWLNFTLSATILLGLLALLLIMKPPVRNALWRRIEVPKEYFKDLQFAFFAWCLSFPFVAFTSQLLEYLLYLLFHIVELPDQLAVYFVKMSFSHPGYFILALLSIVCFAPIVEELLFRGLFQSFLRSHFGPKLAILIASLCFSFFHFSFEQGFGNIPIIASLFTLSLFLGYLYERQGSLVSSITLHALFNMISIVSLYILGETPRHSMW